MTAVSSAITLENLTSEHILAAAQAQTGLSDFGDTGFVEGLDIYLQDLRGGARLNQAGIFGQYQDVLRMVGNRLMFQHDVNRHPEILEQRLAPPIIIYGLPRTGSSKLQRMIAADPIAQRLEVWRILFP
ncbi:MAG TPA: hypothetical protein VKB78_05250, partial [Pirellulales bacterium]|nr:hypothetical protein [Pirellulales bacterium]